MTNIIRVFVFMLIAPVERIVPLDLKKHTH